MSWDNTTTAANTSSTCFRPEPTIIWYWSVRCLISAASIAGNGVIIYLIATRPRLRNTPNMFVMSLAVADFCFGVWNGPIYFPCTFWLPCDQVAMATILYIFLNASIMNLAVLTFDRYLAIVFPLWYQMLLTRQRAVCLIAASWLLSTLPLVPYYLCLYTDSAQAVFILFVGTLLLNDLIPLFGMVLAYLHMVKIVWHHVAQMKSQQAQLAYNHAPALPNRKVKAQESSSLKVIGSVILVFILCNTIVIYRSFCLLVFPGSCSSPESLVMVSRLLAVINSAVNFVIYAMFKVDIRREVTGFCGCLKRIRLREFTGRIWRGNQVRSTPELVFLNLRPISQSSQMTDNR